MEFKPIIPRSLHDGGGKIESDGTKRNKGGDFSDRTDRTRETIYRSGLTTGFILGIQGALLSANKNGEDHFRSARIRQLIMPIAEKEVIFTDLAVKGKESVEFVAIGKTLLNELNELTAGLARGVATNEDVVEMLVKLNRSPKVSEEEILSKSGGKPVFVMGKGKDPTIKVDITESELKPVFDMPKGSKGLVKLTKGSYVVDADGTQVCSIACTSIEYQGVQAIFKVDVLSLL